MPRPSPHVEARRYDGGTKIDCTGMIGGVSPFAALTHTHTHTQNSHTKSVLTAGKATE